MLRRGLWNPSNQDGDAAEGAGAPDDDIRLPDLGVFFSGDGAYTANDWSDVGIDVDLVGDTFQFGDSTNEIVSLLQGARGESQNLSLTYDELSALYPGIVWPLMFELASSLTDGGDSRSVASLEADPEIAAGQNVGPAGLDWRITPDFDDDPGWQLGVIFSPTFSGDDGGLRAGAPSEIVSGIEPIPDAGAGAIEPLVLRDVTQASALDPAELNEQYPGIVWPANWWLL